MPNASTDDKILDEIQEAIIAILNKHNSFCGVAVFHHGSMITSSNEGTGADYRIDLKVDMPETEIEEADPDELLPVGG